MGMGEDAEQIENEQPGAVPPGTPGGEQQPGSDETPAPADESGDPAAAGAAGEAGDGAPGTPGAADADPNADTDDEEERPAGQKKSRNGYRLKIDRLKRQIEEKDQLLHALGQQLPRGQTPGQPAGEKKPEEQLASFIDNMVNERFMQRDAMRQKQATETAFAERSSAARQKMPDFDEVVQDFPVPVDSFLGQTILTSDHGPEIMYRLAKSPAELARLSALPPPDAAREIGRLEAKASVTAPGTTPTAAPGIRKPAPAPISPVTARGPTKVRPVSEMSQAEYNAWRDSQTKR